MHDNEALKNFVTNMPNSDKRFEAIASDPRFNLPKKRAVKSKIDDRFKTALEGDAFKVKTKTDKYGRKLEKKTAKEQLQRFYDFDDDEKKKEESDNNSESSDEEVAPKQAASILDRMRGNVESSEESDSDSDSEDESGSGSDSDEDSSTVVPKKKSGGDDLDIENDVDEYDLGKSQVATGDESHRLAVVNLDWDNLRAADLMVTFNSFIPKNTKINSVSIYPSEFGKQRMRDEDTKGPELDKSQSSNKDTTDYDKDKDYSSKALRKYQLQRLQYYYAIVVCDSVPTAAAIYNNCDGTEYEATANVFDIRYVPDEITFDDEPTDHCTSVPLNYAPQEFITTALQHSKAQLTWDETPKERKDFAARAFSRAEEDDMDFKAYLASDSESESEKTAADKYRALLGQSTKGGDNDDSENENDVDMEITFKSALDEGNNVLDLGTTKKEEDPLKNLSTIEKYRLKEKERRQKRMERAKARKAAEEEEEVDEKKKAELELMLMDDNKVPTSDEETEQNSKDKKKKYKKTKTREKRDAMAEAEADFNTADPRFQALFEDPDYAIDSTNPQFKKTKAMDKLLDERRRRAPKEEKNHKVSSKRKAPSKKEESVGDLVASLRNKKLKTNK